MSEQAKRARREKFRCTLTCWGATAFFSIVAFFALLRSDAWSLLQATFATGFIFVILGITFGLLFCRPLPGPVIGPGIASRPRPEATTTPAAPAPASEAPQAPATQAPAPATEAPQGAPAGVEAAAAPQNGVEALQRIRGVGPKLATVLEEAGVQGLAQIAGWTAKDVAWWDENLEGFRGRVSRDGWVDQARQLIEDDRAGGDAARRG